ncbi:MAG: hypothetical protein HZA18_06055 [Nitrospirae bacterium]|nr:hypothetical protein [Nitrospirota bacterium]
MPFDWDRNKDLTFTIKAVIHQVFKVVLPVLSLLSILSGYYWIWSISPDSLLTEVIVKTKTGIFLTLFGGITLVIGLRRILK